MEEFHQSLGIHLLLGLNEDIFQSLFSPNDAKMLFQKLKALVTNIKWSPNDASDLFSALLTRFELTSSSDRSQLVNWLMKMLHCIEINNITPNWRSESRKTVKDLVEDSTITDEELKNFLSTEKPKTLDEIIQEIRDEKLNQVNERLLADVKDIVASVCDEPTTPNDGSKNSELKVDLKKICKAVKKTTKNKPRLTQMVSWCLMALSEKGKLLQVGTGEGKSCIVAMFAALRALKGEKVDIMSSSTVLAQRDLADWKNFYEVLNISVDSNINKLETDLKKCYKCQVVYGTVEQFAGDWLRHHFERKDIFGKKSFECAIVDEVDSLMLDKGHHVVYIGSEMPALQHLNPLLALIWFKANQYSKIGSEITVGLKQSFDQVVSKHINVEGFDEFVVLQMAEDEGVLAKGSVEIIRKNPIILSEKTKNISIDSLVNFFKAVERKFPSCQFALHSKNTNGEIQELDKKTQERNEQNMVSLLLDKGGLCQYMYTSQNDVLRAVEKEVKRTLHFTPCELKDTDNRCFIPGFLKELVDVKLNAYIENAFTAKTMQMDREYVLEKHGIAPVDYSCTGVVENFMHWSDGLHQFLEMKHGSKLSDMTAITNYMSNVGMLQMYKSQIYGLSGTLGQQAETETLQKIYEGITTCKIPSFIRRKLFEIEGKVVQDESKWIEKICDVVVKHTTATAYRGQRAVLIICETIKWAKTIYRELGDKVPSKKLYVSNNMDNSAIFSKHLSDGDIVIATNLAGRGTDIQICESVKTAGGLLVLQTFPPRNARVEAQAFGRAGRQGSPGSAQLIICSHHLPEPIQLMTFMRRLLEEITDLASSVQDLFMMRMFQNRLFTTTILSHLLTKKSDSEITFVKTQRDNSVSAELRSYLERHIPNIKTKEELFTQYLKMLDKLYTRCNSKPAESHVAALNEFWGMWLLTKFNENDSIGQLKAALEDDLNKAMQKLRKGESPLSSIHHYTAIGSELRNKGNLPESIEMFTKAIKEDPCWAAIAFYNRAFATLTQKNRDQDFEHLNQALEDLQNALRSLQFHFQQHQFTKQFCTQQIDVLTRLDLHINAKHQILVFFKANIQEAIQKVERAIDKGRCLKVQEQIVQFLASLEYLLTLTVFSITSVREISSGDPLRLHQLSSQPFFYFLTEMNSLETMGLTHIYVLDTEFSLGGLLSKIGRTLRTL